MRPHVDNRARCPASFFRRQPPRRRGTGTPEGIGFRDGRYDRHCLPALQFRRSEDWLAWLHGWRVGQAELRQAELAEFGATLRLPPPENRQLMSSVGGSTHV